MITFQLETWPQFFRDVEPLWRKIELSGTLAERGQEHIDPNVMAYEQLDNAGKLIIMTARSDGELVGYATSVIHDHPHFKSTKVGFGDASYLAPEHRKGWTGLKLFKLTEKVLRDLKVQRYYLPVFEQGGMEKIFNRLGFKAEHTIHSKWLGE